MVGWFRVFGKPATGRGLFALLPVFFAFFSLAAPLAHGEEAEDVCVMCHLEQDGEFKAAATEWENSAHAKAGVTCAACHGGNPADVAIAMDPAQGWKPRPKREEIARMCAKCHADPLRMRQYNLRTDQYDLYAGSVHGKKMAAHDVESATCTDCHGKHEIRKIDDPLAPVNRKNVVQLCGSCHSSQKMMEKRHLPWNEYDLYKGSVHGQAYFERGDLGTPTCVNCHSNHGIQKPQQMATRFVCAECHIEQADAYKKSRHWIAAQETGKPLCINCHSNHAIARPTTEKFSAEGDLDCRACHAKNSIQMEGAASLAAALAGAKGELDRARAALKGMEEWSGSGFETSQLKASITRAEKIYLGMRTAAHSLDVKSSQADSESVKQISGGVTADVERMMAELRKRKIGLAITWLVGILFSVDVWQPARYCKRD